MSGRLTVITGGGRGIGASTALRPAADGHVVRADVSDADQVDALFGSAARLGRVTGPVTNAGSTLHSADLADTPVEIVRRVVEGIGAVLVARRAVRATVAGGAIVNVSSAAATLAARRQLPLRDRHHAAGGGWAMRPDRSDTTQES